jgi:hypothetical protein
MSAGARVRSISVRGAARRFRHPALVAGESDLSRQDGAALLPMIERLVLCFAIA